jgi:hypothetical protein
MNRKYLDDIGVANRPDTWNLDDVRQEEWRKERETYGFDERETWDMNASFHLWLYERLKYFLEFAPINLEYHKFEFKGKIYTQQQMIKIMLERLEFSFSDDYNDFDEKQVEYVSEIESIWAIVASAMWW